MQYHNRSGIINAVSLSSGGCRLWAKSPFTGKTYSMDMDTTIVKLDEYFNGYGYIQDVFPDLTPAEREFIMTSIPNEEYPHG